VKLTWIGGVVVHDAVFVGVWLEARGSSSISGPLVGEGVEDGEKMLGCRAQLAGYRDATGTEAVGITRPPSGSGSRSNSVPAIGVSSAWGRCSVGAGRRAAGGSCWCWCWCWC